MIPTVDKDVEQGGLLYVSGVGIYGWKLFGKLLGSILKYGKNLYVLLQFYSSNMKIHVFKKPV